MFGSDMNKKIFESKTQFSAESTRIVISGELTAAVVTESGATTIGAELDVTTVGVQQMALRTVTGCVWIIDNVTGNVYDITDITRVTLNGFSQYGQMKNPEGAPDTPTLESLQDTVIFKFSDASKVQLYGLVLSRTASPKIFFDIPNGSIPFTPANTEIVVSVTVILEQI